MTKGKNGLLRDKRGISPVVATVILVAVTIVVAVAVAYWMGGIAALYTRFEKLEITSAYASYSATYTNWTVTVNLRNTGSADATITGLLVNGKPYTEYGANMTIVSPADFSTNGVPIPSGKSGTIVFRIEKGGGFQAGVSIEIKLHSASGQDYPKTITLD